MFNFLKNNFYENGKCLELHYRFFTPKIRLGIIVKSKYMHVTKLKISEYLLTAILN